MNNMDQWIQGIPTVEQVAQHADKHGGWWMEHSGPFSNPILRRLGVSPCGDKSEVFSPDIHWRIGACPPSPTASYFPVGPDGLPVDYIHATAGWTNYDLLTKALIAHGFNLELCQPFSSQFHFKITPSNPSTAQTWLDLVLEMESNTMASTQERADWLGRRMRELQHRFAGELLESRRTSGGSAG